MTIKTKHNLQNASRGGFTLLELLLSIVIFGGIMFAIIQILQDYAKYELARSTADYTETVAEAVESSLTRDMNVFLAFYNDILDTYGSGLGVAEGKSHCSSNTCALEYPLVSTTGFNFRDGGTIDFTEGGVTTSFNVPKSTVLNENFRDTNPLKSPIRIILSIANNPGAPNTIPALHVMVASTQRTADENVRYAASEAGSGGGWLRGGTQIQSAYGAWSFDVSDFNDTGAATSWADIVTADPPQPNGQGTYFMYYRYINYQDSSGDYLYRQQQSNPELHTMYSSINMGNNDIIGADNITVSDDMTIENQIVVQGAAHIEGNLSLQAGSLNTDGNVNMANATIERGGFISDSAAVTTINMADGGRIQAQSAEFNDVDLDRLDLPRGDPSTGIATLGPGVTFNNAGLTFARSLFFSGNTNIQMDTDFQASNMTSSSALNIDGNIGLLQLNAESDSIPVDIEVEEQFRSPQISLEEVDLSSGTFGACDLGCGN